MIRIVRIAGVIFTTKKNMTKYLVIKKISSDPNDVGKYPHVDEIFDPAEYGIKDDTIKYWMSHGYITTYHEGM